MRYTGDDDPFGINLRSMGDTDSHRYTGLTLDEAQDQYYSGARYYFPNIGRFLSGDPNQEFDNLYDYVGNSPISMKDPDGKNARIYVNPQMGTIRIVQPIVLTSKTITPEEMKGILEGVWNNGGKGWTTEVPKAGMINNFLGRTSTFKVTYEAVVVASTDKASVSKIYSVYGTSVNQDFISDNIADHMKFRKQLGFSDWKSADSEVTLSRDKAVMASWTKQGGSPPKDIIVHETGHQLGLEDWLAQGLGSNLAPPDEIMRNTFGIPKRTVKEGDIDRVLKALPSFDTSSKPFVVEIDKNNPK